MHDDNDDVVSPGQIYLVRLGEKGAWHDRSLAEGLLRIGWEKLSLEAMQFADETELKRLVLSHFPAMDKAKVTQDANDIVKLRTGGSADIWVAIHPNTKQLSWTRLQRGQIEGDAISHFRRTTGWQSTDTIGSPIDGLSDEVHEINRTASRAVNRLARADRALAMRRTILGAMSSPQESHAVARPADPPVSAQQREILTAQWSRLGRSIGSTRPIGTAGHGLQMAVRHSKPGWCASLYWSNSKRGNAVSFCVHPRRFALDGYEVKCRSWLKAWSAEFGGREAEIRSGEEDLQDAVRFGFDFESALRFLTHFADTMTNFSLSPFRKWDNVPSSGVVEAQSAPLISPTGDESTDAASPSSTEEGGPAGGGSSSAADNRWARSIEEMVRNARGAAAESGAIRMHEVKTKEFGFAEGQLERHLEALIASQGGLCKLTGLPLHFIGQDAGEPLDEHRLASLDRIDSDGGYVERNLQVVCRFVNKWKGTYSQDDFCRHLALVRSVVTL